MPDDQHPEVPEDSGDSGAQRPVGERRQRRLAERAGQVDLDATMSHWPVSDPPTSPRPVVRPARPTLDGVATAPVLPPPGQLVIGPLLEARVGASTGSSKPPAGGRRSRRRAEAEPADPGDGAGGGAGTGGSLPDAPSAPRPAPTSFRPDALGGAAGGGRGGGGAQGPVGRGLSWPPGRREVVLAAAVLAVVLLVVLLLGRLSRGDDGAAAVPPPTVTAVAQQTPSTTLADPVVALGVPTGGDPAGSTEPIPGDLP